MTRTRKPMTDQNEILRLKGLGKSKSRVAKLLKINRETVIKYWDGPPAESMEQIPKWVKEIDWDYLNKELKKTSKKILYNELHDINELPSYQAFCEYLRNHAVGATPEITIKIHRLPGTSIEVDYSGDGIQIINPATGEIFTAQLFVGTLSYSGYFYGEFTLTQQLEDFIEAHKNMFSFFGGVASYIIPDNCKTAIIKNNKIDPIIHPTYQDMCVHYGIAVDPADPRSPTHKPNVENAIGMNQKEFFGIVRNMTFTSLIDLNSFYHDWMIKKIPTSFVAVGKAENFFMTWRRKAYGRYLKTATKCFFLKKQKYIPTAVTCMRKIITQYHINLSAKN